MSRAVTCSGCGRRIGVSPNRLPGYLFCESAEDGLVCSIEHPAGKFEERDALIAEAGQLFSFSRLAEEFGVSRQRVQQIITARRGG